MSEHAVAIDELRTAVGALFSAERRLRVRDHSRHGELTVVQIRVLKTLAGAGQMTAGELARGAALGPASVTGLLDQLEELGMVERRRSADDRRVCNVTLTAHGAQLLEQKLARWNALWEESLAELSAEQLRTGARVVLELAELYGELGRRLLAAA